VLHENLREKGRILTNKRIVAIEQGDDFARAILSDGTSETGDIIIGCDGVYSTVRRLMNPPEDYSM